MGLGAVPDLRRPGRGEDPPIHRDRQPPVEGEGRRPRRGRCPTTPLTRSGRSPPAARPQARARRRRAGAAARLPRRRRHLAKVAAVCTQWGAQCTGRTLVIADEAHHLGKELAWGEGFALAFRNAARWLLLSGTPIRCDTTPIPASATTPRASPSPTSPTPTPTRCATASAGRSLSSRTTGRCSGLGRRRHRGRVRHRAVDARGVAALPDRDQRRAGRRPPAHPRRRPRQAPRGPRRGHRDAGGLVVAADSEHARKIAKLLKDVGGKSPTRRPAHRGRRAQEARGVHRRARGVDRRGQHRVRGVDIPRLRVGVYASAAKTPLIFRQVVGRFVRTIAGGRPRCRGSSCRVTRCCAATPPTSRASCATSCAAARPTRSCSTSAPSVPRARRAQAADYIALSADMAPTWQMSLFGGAPVARPRRRSCRRSRRRPGRDRPAMATRAWRRAVGLPAAQHAARQAPPPGRRPRPQRPPLAPQIDTGSTRHSASPAWRTPRWTRSSLRQPAAGRLGGQDRFTALVGSGGARRRPQALA